MSIDMIYYASIGKRKKILNLLQEGLHVDALNHNGESALFYAAKKGHLSTVKCLLKYGAEPNR